MANGNCIAQPYSVAEMVATLETVRHGIANSDFAEGSRLHYVFYYFAAIIVDEWEARMFREGEEASAPARTEEDGRGGLVC